MDALGLADALGDTDALGDRDALGDLDGDSLGLTEDDGSTTAKEGV
jgi:hypothetical protein